MNAWNIHSGVYLRPKAELEMIRLWFTFPNVAQLFQITSTAKERIQKVFVVYRLQFDNCKRQRPKSVYSKCLLYTDYNLLIVNVSISLFVFVVCIILKLHWWIFASCALVRLGSVSIALYFWEKLTLSFFWIFWLTLSLTVSCYPFFVSVLCCDSFYFQYTVNHGMVFVFCLCFTSDRGVATTYQKVYQFSLVIYSFYVSMDWVKC